MSNLDNSTEVVIDPAITEKDKYILCLMTILTLVFLFVMGLFIGVLIERKNQRQEFKQQFQSNEMHLNFIEF